MNNYLQLIGGGILGGFLFACGVFLAQVLVYALFHQRIF